MKKLFFGGIHPADKKALTCHKEDVISIDPQYVVIPLSQHIGAPCKPLVMVGDRVLIGQKIGDNDGLCAPVHASVSGTVVGIEPRLHVNGSQVLSIIIKNDHRNLWDETAKPYLSSMYDDCSKNDRQNTKMSENKSDQNKENGKVYKQGELFKIIREAGIVGMGGATFPTEVKVSSSKDKIDTLIINACECEPYITADDILIRRNPEQILKGIALLANELNPEQTFLAIEDNKAEAIEVLKKYLQDYPMIQLQVLKTRYPQGAEKQLILALTGREVPPGQLPASVGCAVFNVSTTEAVASAVYEGKPLVRRIVTVTGEGISRPQNFDVPIGTPFSVLIEAAGGLTEKCRKVIAGGPMMGRAQASLDVSVIKGTGAVLCLEEDAYFDKKCWSSKDYEEMHPTCIRCGKCVEVCPMYLQPLYLYRYSETDNLNMLEKYHLMDCIECGCCAYTCPGKLPLVDSFRAGKLALREKK